MWASRSEEIVGFGFYRMFHPEDVERMRESWEEIVATKQPNPVDARIRRFDGEYRWFNLQQSPLLDPEMSCGGTELWSISKTASAPKNHCAKARPNSPKSPE